MNGDQEKERGRSRGAEQRVLVRKSDDLDTSNHSATNLLCVLREVMPLSWASVSPLIHTLHNVA